MHKDAASDERAEACITKVFINGFGRIGRTLLRAHALGYGSAVHIVGINDMAQSDLCAHLFAYDSVFGPFLGQAELRWDRLVINGKAIPIYQTDDVGSLDLANVDVLLECTGKADTRPVAEAGLRAGASRVLISGPSAAADITIVLGANDHLLADQPIVSNASCTTNALAPLVRLIDDHWGLKTGWMTTIHCYTGSQPTIDAPRGIFCAAARRACRWCRQRHRRKNCWAMCCRRSQAGSRRRRCVCLSPPSLPSTLRSWCVTRPTAPPCTICCAPGPA